VKQEALILYKKNAGAIRRFHHWIFSGAVKQAPDFTNGEILPVICEDGEFLGYAYCNRRCSIYGRMLSFDRTQPREAVTRHLREAVELRRRVMGNNSDACRLVNGEGDLLPGLVVDKYNDILVVQIGTLGMERLKDFITETLTGMLRPVCIYEKSLSPSRREEGLRAQEGLLYGTLPGEVVVAEGDLKVFVDIPGGQKTGFFFDQREMRALVRACAGGRHVLDCFSYSGGFTLSALKGGASQVTAVDSSQTALDLGRRHLALNGFSQQSVRFFNQDVVSYLENAEEQYDLVVLDPPAFAKKKAHLKNALKAYQRLGESALKKMAPHGLLFTFSCSYYITEQLFHDVYAAAARGAGRGLKILQRHRQGFDHPLNIFHKEGDYLTGLVCEVL